MWSAYRPRKGTVNLDLPPCLRWKDLVTEHREAIIPYFRKFNLILAEMQGLDQKSWSDAVPRVLPLQLYEEAYSIAKYLNHSEVTDSSVLLMHAMYEIGMPLKTSDLMMASGEGGAVIHGRNQEMPLLAPIAEVTFVRGGSPLYTAPVFLGTVGVSMAVKHGMWSFSQVGYPVPEEDALGSVLERLRRGHGIPSVMVRQYLDQGLSYGNVLQNLKTLPVARAQKFLLSAAGPYQGHVITRTNGPGAQQVHGLGSENMYLFENSQVSPAVAKEFLDMKLHREGPHSGEGQGVAPVVSTLAALPVHTVDTVFTFVMAPAGANFCGNGASHMLAPGEGTSAACARRHAWSRWAPVPPPPAEEEGLPEFPAGVRPPGDTATFFGGPAGDKRPARGARQGAGGRRGPTAKMWR